MTLVTCYPFYYVGSAPKRFIVHAALMHPRKKLRERQLARGADRCQALELRGQRGSLQPEHFRREFLIAASFPQSLFQNIQFDAPHGAFEIETLIGNSDHGLRAGLVGHRMPPRRKREIARKKARALAAEDDGLFHRVLQLTDIAGPVMSCQAAEGLVGDLLRGKILLPADLLDEMPGERGHIGRTLPQRRQS